ncbi:twin-arginine translocase TatA/TatE family subunit [Dehalogenimonas sp. THU2]|uniref:twin-arginine translocase TatA/TatE family subunit n=1 Tax=Dehalogenimonas sp. THU2 TaxID=3151121 RepID=UPI0032184828
MRLGPMELVIILVIVLLIFGVGKLPQVGEALGKGLKSFQKASSGEDEEEVKEEKKEEPVEAKTEIVAVKPETEEKPKTETADKA